MPELVLYGKISPRHHVPTAALPCVEVEATKEHHGHDEDGSDGQGDVGTGGQTGEEVAERHHHLQDQEGDAQEGEEPLGLGVELGHPVEDGEQDGGLQDVQRQLHDLLGEEVGVSPVGPVEMLPEETKYCWPDWVSHSPEEDKQLRAEGVTDGEDGAKGEVRDDHEQRTVGVLNPSLVKLLALVEDA